MYRALKPEILWTLDDDFSFGYWCLSHMAIRMKLKQMILLYLYITAVNAECGKIPQIIMKKPVYRWPHGLCRTFWMNAVPYESYKICDILVSVELAWLQLAWWVHAISMMTQISRWTSHVPDCIMVQWSSNNGLNYGKNDFKLRRPVIENI